uniref:Uncharacterized protein n=1 Tax=Caenorhabditis japonica TaxID=281687 RepID=A0A8R1I4H6_CAEJA
MRQLQGFVKHTNFPTCISTLAVTLAHKAGPCTTEQQRQHKRKL